MKREDMIRDLKAAAQTIFDNAESIVGTEKTVIGFDVTIHMWPGDAPTINIYKDIAIVSDK